MQWLIDIIKEWILSQKYATEVWAKAADMSDRQWVLERGYLTTGYVRRPAVTGWDFSEADFIEDGTWRWLDLSAIVPDGAKAVHFISRFKNTAIGEGVHFGHPDDITKGGYHSHYTLVAGARHGWVWAVALDTDRKIKYLLSASNWPEHRIRICGWWL